MLLRNNVQCHPDQKAQANQLEGINMTAVYGVVLRMLVYLNEREYTSAMSNERQADVDEHGDLPDPASDQRISQG
jgi:hypothetical protein